MDARHDIELPFTFECPCTGAQICDLTFCVDIDGDNSTGEVLGWEIANVFMKGMKGERVYLDTKQPIVAAIIEILHACNSAISNEFDTAVREKAYEDWRAAA